MLQRCLLAFAVALQTRRIHNPDLRRDVLDHHVWDIQRIREERAQESDRDQLHPEPEAHVITASIPNQPKISVIQEKQPI